MNHLFSCDSHPVLGPEARRRHHDHRPQPDPQVRLQRVLALRARNKYGLSSALAARITSGCENCPDHLGRHRVHPRPLGLVDHHQPPVARQAQPRPGKPSTLVRRLQTRVAQCDAVGMGYSTRSRRDVMYAAALRCERPARTGGRPAAGRPPCPPRASCSPSAPPPTAASARSPSSASPAGICKPGGSVRCYWNGLLHPGLIIRFCFL